MFGGEKRKPGEVAGSDHVLLREIGTCRDDRPEIVCFREEYAAVFPLVRRFADDREVQKAFVQFFRDLFGIAARYVEAETRVDLLELAYLTREIADLI